MNKDLYKLVGEEIYELPLEVKIWEGLHFRPIARIIEVLNSYNEDVSVGKLVDGKIEDYLDAKKYFSLICQDLFFAQTPYFSSRDSKNKSWASQEPGTPYTLVYGSWHN